MLLILTLCKSKAAWGMLSGVFSGLCYFSDRVFSCQPWNILHWLIDYLAGLLVIAEGAVEQDIQRFNILLLGTGLSLRLSPTHLLVLLYFWKRSTDNHHVWKKSPNEYKNLLERWLFSTFGYKHRLVFILSFI